MTLARRSLWFAGLAVVMAAGFLTGCSDDNGSTKPTKTTGTLEIEPVPHGIDAPWEISGPGGFSQTGRGDTIFTDRAAGDYELIWGEVSDYWTCPDPETKTLTAGATLTFEGCYVEADFVFISPGTFMMGSPADEPGRSSDRETQHEVTLTQAFYISKYEVTDSLWYEVMGGAPTTSRLPKNYVSWDMAVEFCNALSKRAGLDTAYTINGPDGDVTWNRSANGYRLPTEAEWEYACRAGSQTAFANGPITNIDCNPLDPVLDQIGWYCGNSGGDRHEVGQKQANAWGLYDMHGNVWEWVWDGYRLDYQNLDSVDPLHDVGPGARRVLRGGSWFGYARFCRSAVRYYGAPDITLSGSGLRPVRSAD